LKDIKGGGIVGITAGYLLKKEATKFAIIEASRIIQISGWGRA
jgi:2-polyprenyl-6-methoxyphenol hydroxylase-like FAD-dependent oxidoreductase